MGTHLLTKTRATRSRGRQNSPAQQHAKSQISPMVRPRTSNEGAFDRLASRSTRLKHRLVGVASLSLRYVTVARRYGLFDCSDFFIPPRIQEQPKLVSFACVRVSEPEVAPAAAAWLPGVAELWSRLGASLPHQTRS
jgi:hypothetical protein